MSEEKHTTETQQATAWPPYKYAFESLRESGELEYNTNIKWDRIEKIIGFKRHGDNEWKFRGEYMNLCQMVKEAGFCFTERGMNNEGVRVLSREEMASYVREKEYRKANDSLRSSIMLSQVPREGLSDCESKKIEHWEAKSAVIGATTKMLLRKRSLPSPEMAVKSLKQIAFSDQ